MTYEPSYRSNLNTQVKPERAEAEAEAVARAIETGDDYAVRAYDDLSYRAVRFDGQRIGPNWSVCYTYRPQPGS